MRALKTTKTEHTYQVELTQSDLVYAARARVEKSRAGDPKGYTAKLQIDWSPDRETYPPSNDDVIVTVFFTRVDEEDTEV